MKLIDLEPKWWAEAGRHGQGVSFRCPCLKCAADPASAVRLGVALARPLDGGSPFPVSSPRDRLLAGKEGGYDVPPGICWQNSGDTFETLTLSPSVDASASGHWHGWVQGGEVR